ncbi:MAG: hypothetical protein AAGJ52_04925 [Pseudomonadota bacterium]
MITRFLGAVVLGMLVGLITYEGLLAAHAFLFPHQALIESLMTVGVSPGTLLNLCVYWTIGACVSALMASAWARSHWAGALCAMLWSLPLLLLIGLSPQPQIRLLLALGVSSLAWPVSQRLLDVKTP